MLDDDFMGFHGLESGITSRILFKIIVGGVSHPSDVKNYRRSHDLSPRVGGSKSPPLRRRRQVYQATRENTELRQTWLGDLNQNLWADLGLKPGVLRVRSLDGFCC